MGFPKIRMRRSRTDSTMRRLVRETNLSMNDLVYPLFVKQGEGLKQPINSMADCFHFSPDTVAVEAAEIAALGYLRCFFSVWQVRKKLAQKPRRRIGLFKKLPEKSKKQYHS